MATVKHVEINGEKHEVGEGKQVTLVVEDNGFERRLTFDDRVEESLYDEDGDFVEDASSDYEDLFSIAAEHPDEDDEEDDDDGEFDDEDEDDLGDEDDDEEEGDLVLGDEIEMEDANRDGI